MMTIKFVQRVGSLDLKNVQRDSVLLWMALLPIAIALVARFILPLVLQRVSAAVGYDLLPYYPFVMSSALLLLAPTMYGVVVGFVLLDQRDDRTLLALEVTPLPLGQYVFYRIAAPMLLSLILTPLALVIAGVAQLPVLVLFIAVLAAAPLAPLMALLLASFANNKVQGLALMKGLSVFLVFPLLAQGVPEPWQLAFGLLPTYWPIRLYNELLAHSPYAWLSLLAALLLDGVLIQLLLRRFEHVVHQ